MAFHKVLLYLYSVAVIPLPFMVQFQEHYEAAVLHFSGPNREIISRGKAQAATVRAFCPK